MRQKSPACQLSAQWKGQMGSPPESLPGHLGQVEVKTRRGGELWKRGGDKGNLPADDGFVLKATYPNENTSRPLGS